MMRIISLLCLALLAGCSLQGGTAFEQSATGQYDFNWRLSGDPSVAPLQVFGTGRQIWLQFAAGQAVPAIFASTPDGDVLVPYRRQEPYVVIDGEWQSLVLRGGRYTARASRQDALAAGAIQEAAQAPSLQAPPRVSAQVPSQASSQASLQTRHDEAARITQNAPQTRPLNRHAPLTEASASPTALPVRASSLATPQAAAVQVEPSKKLAQTELEKVRPLTAQAGLRAGPPDSTLRGVLARWAAASGWTFEPQHWAVDVDIPLAGTAQFPGDFKQAVRELLASTELSERPVQPCFYANRVLRVIAYTQACDRAAAPAGAAS